jgi:pyridoxal phosphate enzyme (YggS family)
VTRITKNLEDLHQRISAACRAAERSENEVSLLAVSKRHDIASIREAAAAGLNSFGENYVQEALEKVAALGPGIDWHFIGRIQSNKTKAIAANFSWVQTVASARIAARLASQRPANLGPLNVCIQVDIDNNGLHGGVAASETADLCAVVADLPNLTLRGLMAIPALADDPGQQRAPFRQLRELRDELVTQGYKLDTLSMGMTGDLEAAILEGSTLVRIGTALFGARPD